MKSRSERDRPLALVIDDDPVTRLMLTEHLSEAGFDVQGAAGGERGVQLFGQLDPDVVLLDVVMPDMDGFRALHLLSQMQVGRRECPIIMITGLDDGTSIDLAYMGGAADFITKPINWQLLGYRVRYVVRASRAKDELNASKMQLATAQSIAAIGNWSWGRNTRLIGGSDEFRRIMNLAGQDLVEIETVLTRIKRSYLPTLKRHFRWALHRRREFGIDIEIEEDAADARVVHVEGRPVLNCRQVVSGIVGTLQDVTEQKDKERELWEARETALEASRLRAEFVTNITHELRTPMNGIMGMNSLLLSTRLDAEQAEIAADIQLSSERLYSMILNLLDFSNLDAGKLRLELADIDPAQVVERLLSRYRAPAANKGLELILRGADQLPPTIKADPRRLGQALGYLVDNAIKFTHTGAVILDVACAREAGGVPQLAFAICDTGIGIPRERSEFVFAPFTQGDGSMTRRYGGVGLGLPIAVQLVRMMGGQLLIESEIDRGSVFRFAIPLRKGAEPTIVGRRKVPANAPQVLVVSPDQQERDRTAHVLAACGYIVHPTPDPASVPEFAGLNPVAAILVDPACAQDARLTTIGVPLLICPPGVEMLLRLVDETCASSIMPA